MRSLVFLALCGCTSGAFLVSDDADTGPVDATDSGEVGTDSDSSESRDVCARWTSDRQGLTEGTWSGSVNSCDAGDISAEGRASALRLVNAYRWLADLPAVTTDPTKDSAAQECALMMDANDSLSHSPPSSWSCYSSTGATAAGRSNISSGRGTMSVDMYMVDNGNASTLGHRRWILSNSAGPIGLGSTSGSSCMHILGGDGDVGARWTAWPPPGEVPLEALYPPTVSWSDTDETGWSVQSDYVDLRDATVSVTKDGADLPVTVRTLSDGYGSSVAISFIPNGWTSSPGTYSVSVQAVGETLSYDVVIVDCG